MLINYETATDEEINIEILKASLIELVNDQESATTFSHQHVQCSEQWLHRQL
ncbi:hypothetical protein J4710_03345 [Staphylococcus xylosus]|uniref:Uncharacterized protein n=1 Tax=Staphylococcus xylosus TaxID=1288 RepID=A0A939NDN7_STAXY|nr:hypothetical protein [Staphylococcus xylosus]